MPTQQFFSYIIFFWGEEGSADKTLDLITKEYYFIVLILFHEIQIKK
jgi:hypothetical protein